MNHFLITVDTEGDNLWNWKIGDSISTQNAIYLERFQLLCEEFDFIPVYLINQEMAESDVTVKLLKSKAIDGKCEIGMHMHAWNSNPIFKLENKYGGQPYITEYPEEIIYQKHVQLLQLLHDRFECDIVSYRSGRWATNEALFNVLNEIGIKVDCSIVPGMDFSKNYGQSVSQGNNYTNSNKLAYRILGDLIEIPMTARHIKYYGGKTLKEKIVSQVKGRNVWLRPAFSNSSIMKKIIRSTEHEKTGYAEFMIHSSELMAGGSPYYSTNEDIEVEYRNIEDVFKYARKNHAGISLANYREELLRNGLI